MINLDEYADVSTHLIPLYCKNHEMFIAIDLEMDMFLKKLEKLFSIKT